MQIIIPMAGSGQRFVKAGYKNIKPLIEVGGRPIIEYVISLFPGEQDFLFICNNEHLKNSNLKKVLLSLKPKAEIFGIDGHNLGPVQSVILAREKIKNNEPAVVNYCDFDMHWDYAHFKKQMATTNADGAVVAYTGFHPHLLGPNFYAGVRAGDNSQILEVKEKHSFAPNKVQGWHSNGTYYFKSGSLLKKYFVNLLAGPPHENGEYYASMPYNLMVRDNLRSYIYPIQYFCQWGTPEDLKDYLLWTSRARENYQPQDDSERQILSYWTKFLSLRTKNYSQPTNHFPHD